MWLMDWSWQRCFFLAEEVDPPLKNPPEMVLIVLRSGGIRRGYISAGKLWVMASLLGGASVVARITGGISVIGS